MPQYFRMLSGIFVAYVLIIGFGDSVSSGVGRILLLGFLLWSSSHLHASGTLRRLAVALGAIGLVSTVIIAIAAPARVLYGVVGGWQVVLLALTIAAIVSTLLHKPVIDTATVLAVLCVYLLLALLFAGVHQILATITPHYLNGAGTPPNSSDLLYFSVITITTVGYGDMTPACLAARAVAVLEAMTGQLYLVSVVAGVVSGWRSPREPRPDES